MRPVCSGHPIFGRVRYKEAVPPVYIRETRPKSAIGKRTPPTHRKDPLRLVGSFPKARLVLGEVAENLCVIVRLRIDQHRTLRWFARRQFIGRRLDDNVAVRLWVLSPGEP